MRRGVLLLALAWPLCFLAPRSRVALHAVTTQSVPPLLHGALQVAKARATFRELFNGDERPVVLYDGSLEWAGSRDSMPDLQLRRVQHVQQCR